MLAKILSKGWSDFYESFKTDPEFEKIETQLEKTYSNPETGLEPSDKNDLLKSLQLVAFEDVKVVILGNRALTKSNGLTFGSYGKIPEYEKIKDEIMQEYPENDKYTESCDTFTKRLASQGVLMLDTFPMTLMKGRINVYGTLWTKFMEALIKYLYKRGHMVWLIMSQKGLDLVNSVTGADKDNGGNKKSDNDKRNVPTNILLKSGYPNPPKTRTQATTTKKFAGCNHFILCNNYLKQMYMEPIDW